MCRFLKILGSGALRRGGDNLYVGGRMQRRIFAGLVAALAIAVAAPASASAKNDSSRCSDVHRGGQCTANFIFHGRAATPTSARLRTARAPAPPPTPTAATRARSRSGTPVEIDGATRPGTLAYSCWIAMQQAGETNADACAYNDFALVRIDPADVGRVSASVPGFGGPTGSAARARRRRRLLLRQLVAARRRHPAQPEAGQGRTDAGNGWSRTVYTVTPGIPGDSGSGFLDAQGARDRHPQHRGHRAARRRRTAWPTSVAS